MLFLLKSDVYVMTDRNWYDSKRRPSSSDSRKGSQHHHHSSSENSFADYRDRGHHRNHADDRSTRDYKKDRYESSSDNHQRKHSSDRHDIRRRGHHRERGDKYSSRGRYEEDERYSPRYQKSHHKNDWKAHEHSSGSSYGSPYSTPPPPAPPTGPIANLSSNTLHTGYNERMSMTSFVNRSLDPRITVKPKKEEVKQNFKLLIDPFLKKGHTTKIIRYDGVLAGQPPVIPKDPRRNKSKIWSIEVCDLPVPDLKLDKNYVGPMPRDTVRFSGLNDNIDRKFLHELCEAYGDIKEYKVYLDPKTNRHTGTGKVVFVEGTQLHKLISSLNGRTVMGKVISVWIEEKQPPGFTLLKEIKTECTKSRTRLIESPSQIMPGHHLLSGPSPHLSTPRTPNISSLQRNHPVAGFNIHDKVYSSQTPPYKSDNQPPPPPPMMSGQTMMSGVASHMLKQPLLHVNTPPPPPPPLAEYENISPTGNDSKNKNWFKDGKPVTPLELVKRQNVERPNSPYAKMKHVGGNRISYSPVSNSSHSVSPVSPVVKDVTPTEKKVENFDAISDNESSAMQLEDISPVNTPKLKSRRLSNDDDAMSLSSISSNEDQKVELNIKFKPIVNINTGSKPSGTNNPPNIPPNNIQNFQSNVNTPTQFFPRQAPIRHPPAVMNWQQQFPRPSFPPPMFPNNANPGLVPPSNIVSSLNRPPLQLNSNMPFPMNNTILNPLSQPRQAFNMMQNNAFTTTAGHPVQPALQQMPVQNNNVYSSNKTSDGNQVNEQFPTMVPMIPQDLPFIFQVKAGCARDISLELKRILAKDTLKKLVEQSAFVAFENWWETQRTSKLKSDEETGRVKSEKTDVVDTNRKLLTDKSSNIVVHTQQSIKDAVTTSVMLQNLFGHDKNNENRPPAANFLNSFRISRKPQAQPIMKANHMSRKRPQWPSLSKHKNKLQRLEDSEEEEDDDDDDNIEVDENQDDIDEEQFERFARRQRQVRKSGSSLYQKIYSDESDEETDEKSQTDDEDDKEDVSSSEESSSETSSSETDSSETESESEEEVESVKKQAEEESQSEAVIEASSQDDDEAAEKVLFRSMYDEPRKRKAVQKAEEKIKRSHPPKPKPKPASQRPTRPPRPPKKAQKVKPKKHAIVEDSETETAEEEFSSDNENHDTKEEESNITVDESSSRSVVEKELETKVMTEEELIQNLILLEHNYFSPPPPPREIKKSTLLVDKLEPVVEDDGESEAMKFPMRSIEEENQLIWNIITKGIDSEDLCYLKEAFDSLQQFGSKELDQLTWAEHPDLPPQKPKRSKGEAKLRVHETGCARSEGYYKIPMVEKARYLKSALRKLNILQQKGNHTGQAATEHKIKSRENRAMQRRLASSIAQEEFGSLINYNQTLKMRKKALRFAKSSIHNWGLFTCEPIPADQFVCEYVGQMIRAIVAEVRERRYERSGIGSSYLFRLDMESVIDATKNGCNARFINHSCQPNCYAKVILVEGAKKIVIYSKRDIKLGEEITYDYKFPIEDEKIPCLCGAPSCRGSLN